MWVLLLLLLADPARTMCPSKCKCKDDVLEASCKSAVLEVVPIQLNPEARYLDLSFNKISNVHYTLRIYSSLHYLDLSSNRIKTLGINNFDSQHVLTYLNLSRNQVDSLPKDSLRGMHNLTELDLSHNRIDSIHLLAFHDLSKLEILRMTNNQIINLEAGLFKFTKFLKALFLDYNYILEVPKLAIIDTAKLQTLSLSNNLIEKIGDDEMPNLSELRIFILNSNIINEIAPGALASLISLEYLNLNDNNFTTIPTHSLAKLSNLTTLHFGENFIESVPPVAFRGLFQLRSLHLNKLDLLVKVDARAFVDNINLENIWLDENIAMSSYATRIFHGNPQLSHISIRNNMLSTLEVSHFPLDQLKILQIGGNPFQCNCSLLWLWRLIQEQLTKSETNATHEPELVIDTEEIKCAGPEPLDGILLLDATESQVDCSLGWIAIVSATLFACLLLGAASVLLYFGPVKRHLNKSSLPPRENSSLPDAATHHPLPYADPPCVDKFIIGPTLIPDYRALPPWDSFGKPNEMDVYRQFNPRPKSRPHIVYV